MIRHWKVTAGELNFIQALTRLRLAMFLGAVLITGAALYFGGIVWLLAFASYCLVGFSFADDSPTWTGLYGSRGLAPDAAQMLAKDHSHVLSVARNPNAPKDLLVELAATPTPDRAIPTAAAVAAIHNPAFPLERLGEVSARNNDALETALSAQICPFELKDAAIKSSDPTVRRLVASRNDLSTDQYDALGNDPDPTVREVVAGNVAAPSNSRKEASGN